MDGITLEDGYSDVMSEAKACFASAVVPAQSYPLSLPWGEGHSPLAEAIVGRDAVMKRTLDVAFSLAALLALSPALLLIAAAIRLDSPGPAIFRQRRTGLGGSPIHVLKFRTMHVTSADHGGMVQTSRGDKRVTRIGGFLRRRSLDELPQFLNVLGGSMPLVGPRPHALQTTLDGVPLWARCPSYRLRYRVKPGITGLAQVCGYRGELDAAAKLRGRVRLDLLYIARWSFLLDVRLVALTAAKVLFDPRAY